MIWKVGNLGKSNKRNQVCQMKDDNKKLGSKWMEEKVASHSNLGR